MVTDELSLLRTIELKGRVRPEDVAQPLAIEQDEAATRLDGLVDSGLVLAAGRGFRLSDDGRGRIASLLDDDRSGVDQAAMSTAYDGFCAVNADLKQVITDWQVRPDGSPNDHADADYDAAVIARLQALHERFTPLLEDLATIAPRLQPYARRFAHALERIAAGETPWVARPIMDSYHTVWFELHEDLIQLCGLTRAGEAAAGRAH